MIGRVLLILGGALMLNLLTACGPKDTDSSKAAPPDSSQETAKKGDVPSFDPDKGLYLPEATRQSMGITTAKAQGKSFQAEQTMKFQVFREEDEQPEQPFPGMAYRSGDAYASTILTDVKPELEIGQTGEVTGKQNFPTAVSAKIFQINKLPNTGQTEVLVEITDPNHQFTLGDFCAVQWKLLAVDAPTAVPDSALLKTTEGNFVYVQKDDRFVRTEIKLGATGEGFTAITEGVAVGDSVVTNPAQTLWLTELKLKSGGSEP